MIKLIAVDLDDTLLNKNKEISKENKIAVNKANNQNIKIVIASGRPYFRVLPILEELNLNNDNNYEHEVISFNSLNDEIEFIVNDIISKDLDLNKVYLANVNKDNENTILRVFNNYNIKVNFKNSSTLFDTEIGKSFLNNIFNYQKELNNIKDQEIKNIIINILNKYYWTNITEIKNIIIEEFKAAKLPSQKYNNAINIIDLKDNIIDDDEYIYLLL